MPPQESFLDHMKDEINDNISKCREFTQIKKIVDDWMDYYSHDFYVRKLNKLSPK